MTRDYFAVVPKGGQGGFTAPPTATLPSPAELIDRMSNEGEWLVPYEMVLACSSPVMKTVVFGRLAKHEQPSRNARVICRGKRYFATIFFPGRADLFMALDCWALGDEA